MKNIWKKILIVWILILSIVTGFFLYREHSYIATVMIDPGHGGYDVGAIGYDQETYEKDLTLEIGKQIGKQIKKINPKIKVVFTRTDDTVDWPSEERADLQYRVQMAQKKDADFYLSIHMNASDNTQASGYSFHIREDDALSNAIAESMNTQFEKANWSNSRGIVYTSTQPLYVVDHLDHAMLLETGFITNPSELHKLKSYFNQRKIAKAVALAICENITED